jgi:hypothetical protein
MSSEVEETLKRVQSHKGVKGVIIMTSDGIPIRSTMPIEDTENNTALVLASRKVGLVRKRVGDRLAAASLGGELGNAHLGQIFPFLHISSFRHSHDTRQTIVIKIFAGGCHVY